MSDKIGNRSYSAPQEGQMASQRPYSERTAEIVDEEVRALAVGALERTRLLLTEKKDLMKAVADQLLEKEAGCRCSE